MITAKIQTTTGKVLEATRDVDRIVKDLNDGLKFVSIGNECVASDTILRIFDIIPEEDLGEKVYKEIEKNEEKTEENE